MRSEQEKPVIPLCFSGFDYVEIQLLDLSGHLLGRSRCRREAMGDTYIKPLFARCLRRIPVIGSGWRSCRMVGGAQLIQEPRLIERLRTGQRDAAVQLLEESWIRLFSGMRKLSIKGER